MQERQLTLGRYHEETVGLGHAARDLREELRAGNADRDREADLLEHVTPKRPGDLCRRARHAPEATDIEERLVDREPFHEWRRVLEHLEHGSARVGVRAHPGIDDDRVRTQLSRLAAVHRRAHAVGLRLVAGRQDDARSDEHRPPTQARVVPLLHRRIEGVEVGVEDGRRPGHEHMFAHGGVAAVVPRAGGSPRFDAARAGRRNARVLRIIERTDIPEEGIAWARTSLLAPPRREARRSRRCSPTRTRRCARSPPSFPVTTTRGRSKPWSEPPVTRSRSSSTTSRSSSWTTAPPTIPSRSSSVCRGSCPGYGSSSTSRTAATAARCVRGSRPAPRTGSSTRTATASTTRPRSHDSSAWCVLMSGSPRGGSCNAAMGTRAPSSAARTTTSWPGRSVSGRATPTATFACSVGPWSRRRGCRATAAPSASR